MRSTLFRRPATCALLYWALVLGQWSFLTAAESSTAPTQVLPATSETARARIDFDGRGYLLDGRRTFLAYAEIHPSRIPRELWRDRLLRLQQAGFNGIQIYIFWDDHEPRRGEWDFSGNKDIGAFLDLCHELGLRVIVRPGPYNCAERDSGGLPVWLRFVPDLVIRDADPAYLALADLYYQKLFSIIAPRQIHRGGPVIAAQLENEHSYGWSTNAAELRKVPLFSHLYETARACGLEIPLFFSQQNHGNDPVARNAGNKPWSTAKRGSPWYTTEFWTGWYSKYGALDPLTAARSTEAYWKMIAFGAGGVGVYVAHGGTNFGYTGDERAGASYDYATLVGEAGDLRPIYFSYKRASLFARAFESILADADLADSEFKTFATGEGIAIHARRGPQGAVVFLHNPIPPPAKGSAEPTLATLPARTAILADGTRLDIAPGEFRPVIIDHPLTQGLAIARCVARVARVERSRSELLLFTRGTPGETVSLDLRGSHLDSRPAPGFELSPTPDGLRVTWTVPSQTPAEITLGHPGFRLRLIALNDTLADATWESTPGSPRRFFIGTGLPLEGFKTRFEHPLASPFPTSAWTLAPGEPLSVVPLAAAPSPSPAPQLAAWTSASAAAPAAPVFDDSAWLASDQPLPMGADQSNAAHAWYRATLDVPRSGDWVLRFAFVRDTAQVFVDGRLVGSVNHGKLNPSAGGWSLPLKLSAGRHSLAVFVSHLGRPKVLSYVGRFDGLERKGTHGSVTLVDSSAPAPAETKLGSWQWTGGFYSAPDGAWRPLERTPALADIAPSAWRDGTPPASLDKVRLTDELADKIGKIKRFDWTWQRTTLPASSGPAHLRFADASGHCLIYVDGALVARSSGGNVPFTIDLPAAVSPRTLAILSTAHYREPAGVRDAVHLVAGPAPAPISGWRMRGGVETELAALSPQSAPALPSVPAFHRTTFTWKPAPDVTAPLRLTWDGLSRGFVWLNGVNVGRFPDVIPTPGLYLPEPLLRSGENTLVILDEEGRPPTAVRLLTEPASTRIIYRQSSAP